MGCVYRATNRIDGKMYVGMTCRTFVRRKNAHLREVAHPHYPFHRAMAKYGIDAFDWDILFESDDRNELIAQEKNYIREMGCQVPKGYNITPGGEGVVHNESMRKKKKELALQQHRDPVKRAKWEEAIRNVDRNKYGNNMRHLHEDVEFYEKWHESCLQSWSPERRQHFAMLMKKRMEEKYGTEREREIHARAVKIARSLGKEWRIENSRERNRVSVLCVEDGICHSSVKTAAEYYGIDRRLISAVLHKRQHTAANRHFVYGEAENE